MNRHSPAHLCFPGLIRQEANLPHSTGTMMALTAKVRLRREPPPDGRRGYSLRTRKKQRDAFCSRPAGATRELILSGAMLVEFA